MQYLAHEVSNYMFAANFKARGYTGEASSARKSFQRISEFVLEFEALLSYPVRKASHGYTGRLLYWQSSPVMSDVREYEVIKSW